MAEPGANSTEKATISATEGSLRQTFQTVGAVVAPTSALTALLFYFGWASSHAEASFFGIDDSTLGYSTQDYLLHSIGAVFLPFGGALLVASLLVWGHSEIPGRLRSVRVVHRVSVALGMLGVSLFGLGVEGTIWPRYYDIVTPLGFAAGVGTFSYAVYLRRHFPEEGDGGTSPMPRGGKPSAQAQIVIILIALSLVWEVAAYADRVGNQLAERVAADLTQLPLVVIYSPKSLQLNGAGVHEVALTAGNSQYGFRTDGLRLLLRSNGRFFLLPEGWSTDNRVTIVLKDRDDIRMEFTG